MTIQEALQIEEEFYMIQSPSEEDIFRYTEAMDFLIRETRQPRYMMSLGGYYYEDKRVAKDSPEAQEAIKAASEQ